MSSIDVPAVPAPPAAGGGGASTAAEPAVENVPFVVAFNRTPAAAVAPATVADAVAAPDVFEVIVVSFVFNRSFCC